MRVISVCLTVDAHGTDGLIVTKLKKTLIMDEWVSVKARLPDEKINKITCNFEYVLCATIFGDVRPYKYGTPIGWKEPHFWDGAGIMDKYVTHWMEFPKMPSGSLRKRYENNGNIRT